MSFRRVRGSGRVAKIGRTFRHALFAEGLILIYHRVAALDPDPFELSVSPQRFAEHLEVIRKYACPLSLAQLIQALRAGAPPRRAVVVTFDDGYADNLYNAKPLLERYEVPATVFVTTGYLGQQRECWHDELAQLALEAPAWPERLTLDIEGRPYDWDLAWSPAERERERQRLYHKLHDLLRPLNEPARRKALQDLQRHIPVPLAFRPSHRTMTQDEVLRLAEGGLVEIGAHTVTHPMLSSLSDQAQRQEVSQSKAILEDLLGRTVRSFSYPYGTHDFYNAVTVAAVREAGFESACANVEGVVWRGTNRWELPRCWARNVDGDRFGEVMNAWFKN